LTDNFQLIDITLIDKPKVLLRPVRKNTTEYHELRDSMEREGNIQSILVRPVGDRYEVVDGWWLTNCAMDLRHTVVPCVVKEMSDEEALAAQLKMNAIRPMTDRMEFARQLLRIQQLRPGITLGDLAVMVNKSANWVKMQLDLMRIRPEYQVHVANGDMTLCNAHQLAKIPRAYQPSYIEDALTMSTEEFRQLAAKVVRSIMQDARNGRLHEVFVEEFQPNPHLRSLKEVKEELANPQQGALCLIKGKAETPLDGWKMALEWALHMDPDGIEEQQRRSEKLHKKHVTETGL
jgi:hypothetical protein